MQINLSLSECILRYWYYTNNQTILTYLQEKLHLRFCGWLRYGCLWSSSYSSVCGWFFFFFFWKNKNKYFTLYIRILLLLLLFEEGKGKTNSKVAAIENTHRRQYRNRKRNQQNKFFHEDGNDKLLFTSFRIIKVFTFNYSSIIAIVIVIVTVTVTIRIRHAN